MEFEQFKLNLLVSDSLKRRNQWQRIYSLRCTTKGSLVIADQVFMSEEYLRGKEKPAADKL